MIGILNKSDFWLQNVALDSKENFSDEFYNFGIVYDSNLKFYKPKLVDGSYIEGATVEDVEAFEDASSPNEISRRQLRLQWQLDGRDLAEIEAKINEIKDAIEKIVALNAWTESAIFLRDDILIQTLGASLSMSKSDIREFFKRASLL